MLRPDLIVLAGEIETAVARIHAADDAGALTLEKLRHNLEHILATTATLRVAEDMMRRQCPAEPPHLVVVSLNDERNVRAVRALYRELGYVPVTGHAPRLQSDNLRMPTQALWSPRDDGPRPA